MIVLRHERKAAADQLKTARRRMIVQLIFEVCRLDDARHLHQHGVVREPLMDERRKGSQTMLVLMRVGCAGASKPVAHSPHAWKRPLPPA